MDSFWSLEIFSWLFHLSQKYALQWESKKKTGLNILWPLRPINILCSWNSSLSLALYSQHINFLMSLQTLKDSPACSCNQIKSRKCEVEHSRSLQLCSPTMYQLSYLSPALVSPTERDVTVNFICSNVFFFAWYGVNLKGEGGGRRKMRPQSLEDSDLGQLVAKHFPPNVLKNPASSTTSKLSLYLYSETGRGHQVIRTPSTQEQFAIT